MELNEKDYVLGYWMAADKENNNWYCFVKRTEDGLWYVEYTFRYSKSHDCWDEKDIKNKYFFYKSSDTSEDEILSIIEFIFNTIKFRYTEYNDCFLVRGGPEKFMEIANKKDYFFMKSVH